MKKIITSVMALAVAIASFHTLTPARADDSATTKVENTASDAKTDAKKDTRKMKRKVRKATGNDSVGKDIKDGANDTKDNVDNAAQKTKNKVNNN